MTKKSLIEFPCYFPIKIIGINTPVFLEEIKQISLSHFAEMQQDALTYKMSKQANYLAITLTFFVENQERLDAFYREVSKHPAVKMVL